MKKRVKVSTHQEKKVRKSSLPTDVLQVGLPDEIKSVKARQTHEVFVELDELEVHDNHLIWKERARWIKLPGVPIIISFSKHPKILTQIE